MKNRKGNVIRTHGQQSLDCVCKILTTIILHSMVNTVGRTYELLQPKMRTDGVRTDRCDQPLRGNFKVDGSEVAHFLNQTPRFDWYVVP